MVAAFLSKVLLEPCLACSLTVVWCLGDRNKQSQQSLNCL